MAAFLHVPIWRGAEIGAGSNHFWQRLGAALEKAFPLPLGQILARALHEFFWKLLAVFRRNFFPKFFNSFHFFNSKINFLRTQNF